MAAIRGKMRLVIPLVPIAILICIHVAILHACLAESHARPLRSTKRKHLVYYAFDLLDKDKSGVVDQSDLVRALQIVFFFVCLFSYTLCACDATAGKGIRHQQAPRGDQRRKDARTGPEGVLRAVGWHKEGRLVHIRFSSAAIAPHHTQPHLSVPCR